MWTEGGTGIDLESRTVRRRIYDPARGGEARAEIGCIVGPHATLAPFFRRARPLLPSLMMDRKPPKPVSVWPIADPWRSG
jgi:hypothetical protein